MLRECEPQEVKREGKIGGLEVCWYNKNTGETEQVSFLSTLGSPCWCNVHSIFIIQEKWDTVLFATGQYSRTYKIILPSGTPSQ